MDDGRRGHPPRRAADREDVPRRRPLARGPTVGQFASGAQDDAAAIPVDHPGRGSASSRPTTAGHSIRLIAGDIAGFEGPGVTHTPITYAHATVAPGAEISVPWNPAFSAMAYVLTGHGTAGPEGRPVKDGQLVMFGPGDHLVIRVADGRDEPLDVLLLGDCRFAAPIAHYGPFVMNTREEIIQAVEDYQAGRLGIVPADQLAPRNFA